MNKNKNTKENNFIARHTFDSKSLLARLLATENITVEHNPQAHTAMFDTSSRTLTLPMWENMDEDTYDMLIGHEVGHALFTPQGETVVENAINYVDAKNPIIAKSFLNIVEDARIERLMKQKFPGLAINFRNGYVKMYEDDMFDVKKMVQLGRQITLIDRLNLRAKCGMYVDNISSLDADEETLFDDMLKTETFEDVVHLTKILYDISRKPKDPPKQQSQGGKGPNKNNSNNNSGGRGNTASKPGDGKGSSTNGPEAGNYQPPSGGNGEEENENQSSGGGSGNEESNDQNDQNDQENSNNSNKQQSNDSQGNNSNPPQAPVTAGAHQKISSQSIDPTKTKIDYVVMPAPSQFDVENYLVDNKIVMKDFAAANYIIDTVKYEKWRKEQMRSLSSMVKEFDLRKAADSQARTSISRSGVIDVDRLNSYKWSEDIFRRNSTVRAGKNHGMVMVIDWSGSMDTVIGDTIRQTMLMALFCRQVNIPFAVYCFSDHHSASRHNRTYDKNKPKNVLIDGVALIEWINSSMNTQQFHKAMALLHTMSHRRVNNNPGGYQLGGTPLCQTAALMRYLIPHFQKKHNVQIMNAMILTDGEDTAGVHSGSRTNSFIYGKNAILRDDATRMQVAIHRETYDGRIALKRILELVRETTHSNLIGFYIVNKSSAKNMIQALSGIHTRTAKDTAILDHHYKTLEEHNYADIKNTGYDSYFVIPSSSLSLDEDKFDKKFAEREIEKRRIATAFKSAMTKNKTSRVFLGRLVDALAVDHSAKEIHEYRKNKR